MSDSETLTNLQEALSMELTATHPYQLHTAVLDVWGLSLFGRMGEPAYIAKHMPSPSATHSA